jgi:hypothetical protein
LIKYRLELFSILASTLLNKDHDLSIQVKKNWKFKLNVVYTFDKKNIIWLN